jgi:hypothetical protein
MQPVALPDDSGVVAALAEDTLERFALPDDASSTVPFYAIAALASPENADIGISISSYSGSEFADAMNSDTALTHTAGACVGLARAVGADTPLGHSDDRILCTGHDVGKLWYDSLLSY